MTGAVAVIAAVAAVAADAAPKWARAVELTRTGYDVSLPQVELTGNGEAVAAWVRSVEAHRAAPLGPPASPVVVQSATRRRGGTWSKPVDLSRPAAAVVPLRLVLSSSGIAVAAWKRFEGMSTALEMAFRRGSWTAAASPPGADGQFDAAVTAAGPAALVWVGDDRVTHAAYRDRTGKWGAPVLLDATGPQHNPRITFDGRGDAVAIWVSSTSEGWVVESARRDARTGVWTVPTAISAPADLVIPTGLVAAGTNAVHASWKSRRGNRDSAEAASRISPLGVWEPPVVLAPPSAYPVGGPELAANSSGTVVGVWSEETTAGRMIARAAYRPADAQWQPPVTLSAPDHDAFGPQVALDGRGNAIAVWRLYGRGVQASLRPRVQASLRPRSLAVWLPPDDLGPGRDAGIALDRDGNGVALWSDGVIKAAALNPSPFLLRLAVPARGSTNARLTFGVERAPWSAPLVSLPRWSFGDGSGARGTRVAHRYRRPGVFTVTVRQSDAAGGTTTLTRRVRIARR